MREVLTDRLWIGNALEARDCRRLHELGICAIVDLAIEEKPAVPPREFLYQRHPLYDGSGNSPDMLTLAVEGVIGLLKREIPTIVACSGGMSRSPSLVATSLAVWENADPQEKLQELATEHPLDCIAPVLAGNLGGMWSSGMTVSPE